MNFPYKKSYSEFNDPYAFADQIAQGKIEHYQLEPGIFHGELIQIISDKVIISTHSMNLSLLQIGPGVSGFTTFLIPGNMVEDFSWRKQRLSGKRIGVLKGDMEHFGIAPSNFYGTPVSLSNDYFNELIIKRGYDENIYKLIQQNEVIDLDPDDAFQIQQMVVNLCNSKNLNYEQMAIELPILILDSINNIANKLPKLIPNSRYLTFNKILEYIHEHLNQKISTYKICSEIEISERNLRYIFKEMTGLSPMKYIKYVKLNKVRKDIRKMSENSEIGIIANKWGIGHLGQFAADYNKLFWELPSDTLKLKDI